MRAAEQDLAIELEVGDILTRGEDWGGQLVRHLTLPPGADFRPLLKGLPDDACSCPHWGYVLAARAGLLDAERVRDTIASVAASYDHREGRAWRDLELGSGRLLAFVRPRDLAAD